MIAGTKADAVLSIIKKVLSKRAIKSQRLLWIWQQIWDSLPKNVFQMLHE